MNGVVHTKRIFPHAVGRIHAPGQGVNWVNPENAMEPGEPYAHKTYQPGTSRYSYTAFLFSIEIPTYANIQEVRWVTRGRLESPYAEELGAIELYSLGYLQGGDRVEESVYAGNWFGRDLAETLTPVTSHDFRLLTRLNDLRDIRALFDITARTRIAASNPMEEEQTIFIDFIALEIDYTLPEFPLQVDLWIE